MLSFQLVIKYSQFVEAARSGDEDECTPGDGAHYDASTERTPTPSQDNVYEYTAI